MLKRRARAPLEPGGPADGATLRVASSCRVPARQRRARDDRQPRARARGRGHVCRCGSDDEGRARGEREETRDVREFFGPFAAGVARRADGVGGADVAVATGWQTVAPVLPLAAAGPGAPRPGRRARVLRARRSGCGPRRATAADGHRGEPWLAGGLRERYGARATPFDLGVDRDLPARGGAARGTSARLRPRRDAPAGGASGLAGDGRAAPPPAEDEIALFGEGGPLRAPSPSRTSAYSTSPRSPARTTRRASASCCP